MLSKREPEKNGSKGKAYPEHRVLPGCLNTKACPHIDFSGIAGRIISGDLMGNEEKELMGALKTCSSCSPIYEMLGDLYNVLGRHSDAVTYFDKALERVRSVSGIFLKRFSANTNIGDRDEAYLDLMKASILGNPWARKCIAKMQKLEESRA